IEYHARVSPLAPDWPDIYLEGWSAKFGMEELLANPEWAECFFAAARKMGVRYMDSYDPTDLALLMPSDLLKRWVDLADRYQIGTGWWNDFGSGYGWGFMAPYYKPYLCKLSPEAERYFNQIVELTRTHPPKGICAARLAARVYPRTQPFVQFRWSESPEPADFVSGTSPRPRRAIALQSLSVYFQ